MLSGIFTALGALLGIVLILVTKWYDERGTRVEQERRDEIQRIRQEILDRDVNAVQSRIDKLQDTTSSNSTREQSAEDIQRRISGL